MIGFANEWNQYLVTIPPEYQDVYFREEYVKLYENDTEKACCFIYQEGNDVFLFPFLRRTFVFNGKTYYDFETAYGYGGAIANNHQIDFLRAAHREFYKLSACEKFVCGFVRFHPLMANWTGFEAIGSSIPDRKTIAIDLSEGIETAWSKEIHTKNRNIIKKGSKNGLVFVVDEDFQYLEDFERLYNSTMDKLDADGFYYFPTTYYRQLKKTLPHSFLGMVQYGGKFIAGAVFFYQNQLGHYHLAGSDASMLHLSPNNFLLWEAAKELYARGVRCFHLGGGTNGDENNSLFLYKRKFSKSHCQFFLGKAIFQPEIYKAICTDWMLNNPDKADRMKNILLKYKY